MLRKIPPARMFPKIRDFPAAGFRKRVRRGGRRGAVALEYVLITALVAIALIGVFRLWGHSVFSLFYNVSWNPGAALKEIVQ